MTAEFVADELSEYFCTPGLFAQVDQLEGEVYRQVEKRRTIKIRLGEAEYFAKIHHGVGWGEIFKNLVQLRLPVLGARNEWLAIERLKRADVSTMTTVLFCETGVNPATRRSAIVTRSLGDRVTLEDLECRSLQLKWSLTQQVAEISRKMHAAGVNHRDYYLCHFLLEDEHCSQPVLYLIDLHRAQIRGSVPERWLVKDIGGLLFSAFDKSLTRRDLLRFIRIYRPGPLRNTLPRDRKFWLKVIARAKRLYLQDHEYIPPHIEQLLDIR